jgi:hypothetical protein
MRRPLKSIEIALHLLSVLDAEQLSRIFTSIGSFRHAGLAFAVRS